MDHPFPAVPAEAGEPFNPGLALGLDQAPLPSPGAVEPLQNHPNLPEAPTPALSSKKLMIALSAVSKHFNGKRKVVALDSVDLHVARGEMVSIVGPSGSGKSTLLNLIGGLDRPTSGEIRIDGQSVAALSDDDLTRLRRDKIGFIFQFFNLLPIAHLRRERGPAAAPQGPARARKSITRARGLLELVRLGHRFDHLPDELSGGERQRVAIARALAVSPADPAGRRAHRQSRHPHRRRNPEPDPRPAQPPQRHHPHRDPRCRRGPKLPAHRHPARRPHRRRRAPMMLLRLISLALRPQAPAAQRAHHRRHRARRGAAGRHAHAPISPCSRRFNQTVDRIAGKAQLQVSAGDSGFAEEVLERVQAVPEVRAAAPGDRSLRRYRPTRPGQAADPGRRYDRRPQPARLRPRQAATTTSSTTRWSFWPSPIP